MQRARNCDAHLQLGNMSYEGTASSMWGSQHGRDDVKVSAGDF